MKRLLLLLCCLSAFISLAQQPFVTTWEVTNTDLEIIIPTNETYNYDYNIDFGDGTVLNNQTGDLSHVYNSAGVYTVTISGQFPQFNGVDLFFISQQDKFKTVEQWGDIQWFSMSQMFVGNSIILNASDTPDLTQVTNMSNMFSSASDFNSNINDWDVSNVTSMSGMFQGAVSFNQPLNNWNVMNVIDFSFMFFAANSFNQPLDNWDVSNANSMLGMFNGSNSFDQNINNWNVTNVNNMTTMFFEASSFNQPLNNWDVSGVSNMNAMFVFATSFNRPLDNWDISNVVDLDGMFANAQSFNQDLSNWNFNNVNLASFLSSSGMDSENYDLVINRLLQLGLVNGTLGAHGLQYCDSTDRQFLIDNGWTIFDEGQADDCNLNYVSGNVLFDSNSNGCDGNDIKVSNYMVSANNGSQDITTTIDENGEYSIGLDSGSYTISVLNLGNNFTSTPTFQTVNFTGENEIIENIDFCITTAQPFTDLAIDIFPLENAIPGFTTLYQIVASNNGTQPIPNVQVSFVYDDNFQSFVNATEMPTVDTNNLLIFDFPNIEPLSQEIIEITMNNAVPPTLNGGEVLTFTTQITPNVNDANAKDNTATHDQTVVNSYDPNDKLVVQGDEIEEEDIDRYLDYRIRFQNLGTANALHVKITDTISNKLDWTTFQPISSSHDYRIEIVDGEQINYYFDNINLPFEAADPEGSNGYITYKIKPKPTVQVGDMIENTAYIYFDFNLPIITNTATTEVIENLSTAVFESTPITIYPNPVKDFLRLEFLSDFSPQSVQLYKLNGKLVKTFGNQKTLDVSRIDSGIYILKVKTDKGSFYKKVVKK